jgi:hypothetical protein
LRRPIPIVGYASISRTNLDLGNRVRSQTSGHVAVRAAENRAPGRIRVSVGAWNGNRYYRRLASRSTKPRFTENRLRSLIPLKHTDKFESVLPPFPPGVGQQAKQARG